jgi:hypothetical protein
VRPLALLQTAYAQLGHSAQTGIDLVMRLYGHPDEKRFDARITRHGSATRTRWR